MATYYHGAPDINPDGLQTLYLMNPSYIDYAESATPANMLLLNPTVSSSNSMNQHHQSPPMVQQQLVGIPLQSVSQDLGHPRPIHHLSSVQVLSPSLQYNLWTQPSNNRGIRTDIAQHQLGLDPSSSALPSAQKALSLSLLPHEIVGTNQISGLQSFLMGSKYLKAAQELLDEVVNVGKVTKSEAVNGSVNKMKNSNKDSEGTTAEAEESSRKRIAADLTTVERQEQQMKKATLVNMLDEVEQRYRQYHHQMQIVVSSFEAIAGPVSARTYTALALQTISKQFRCLREAITGQIQATSKSLGEEDVKSSGSRLRFIDNHLRQQKALQQLGIVHPNAWRPQRGLPERSVSVLRAWLFENFLHPYPKDSDKIMLAKQTGLSRSQVSNWFINARVRLWKPMVEEMYLEETKVEEQNNGHAENSSKSDAIGSPATKSSGQQEANPVTESLIENLKSDQGQSSTAVQASYMSNGQNQISYFDNETITQPSHKKARSNESQQANAWPSSIALDMKPEEPSNQELLLKFMDGRQRVGEQGYSIIPNSISHGGNYGAYTFGELGKFDGEQFTPRYSSNGVSLTLGLPHCENISLSEAQQPFLSNGSMQPLGRRFDMSSEDSDFCSLKNNATVTFSSTAYESNNIQNRKRFAAQLLPDYVT